MTINGVDFPNPDSFNINKEYIGFTARALDGTLHIANVAAKKVLNFSYKGLSKDFYRRLLDFLKQPVVVEIDDIVVQGVMDDIKEERLTPGGDYWKVDCVVREA